MQCDLQLLILHNLLRRRLEGDQILKYMFSITVIKKENSSNIFLIIYEEAMLLEFSSFFSVKYAYNMCLGKIRRSYCYTKLCNYREEVALKPISNISNILVCCNLSFTRFLTLFPLGGGAQSPHATFNFLSSWQFLVFFLDFLGEFLKFILVLDFNWKNSKNLKIFWAWSISQTGPKNEKKIFFLICKINYI